MSHFKVNDSVTLSTFTRLRDHDLYLVPKHFSHAKIKPSYLFPWAAITKYQES